MQPMQLEPGLELPSLQLVPTQLGPELELLRQQLQGTGSQPLSGMWYFRLENKKPQSAEHQRAAEALFFLL